MIEQIKPVREKLLKHQLYGGIHTMDELKLFMTRHVFAVWDFMSLVKRLQREMTCIDLPWTNPGDPNAARLINEIVLGEETDINYGGGVASHLDMYLKAMKEVDADTSMFDSFMAALKGGADLEKALDSADVPGYLKKFVTSNIRIALHGAVEEVAGNFLYGREDAIPDMFSLLLKKWGIDEHNVPRMTYYLVRHIELDGEEHGPAAKSILHRLVGDDKEKHERATRAAVEAVEGRIALWDGIMDDLKALRARQGSGHADVAKPHTPIKTVRFSLLNKIKKLGKHLRHG